MARLRRCSGNPLDGDHLSVADLRDGAVLLRPGVIWAR